MDTYNNHDIESRHIEQTGNIIIYLFEKYYSYFEKYYSGDHAQSEKLTFKQFIYGMFPNTIITLYPEWDGVKRLKKVGLFNISRVGSLQAMHPTLYGLNPRYTCCMSWDILKCITIGFFDKYNETSYIVSFFEYFYELLSSNYNNEPYHPLSDQFLSSHRKPCPLKGSQLVTLDDLDDFKSELLQYGDKYHQLISSINKILLTELV